MHQVLPNAQPKGEFLRWMDESPSGPGTSPDEIDLDLVKRFVARMRPLFGPDRAYFRTEVHGWDNIPDRPSLLVCNHSGGTTIPDPWGLGLAWYRHFGSSRVIHALAHEMVFALKATAVPFSKLGVLRANREMAARVLTEFRRDLVVYPGGDLDTWRPWKDRYKVRFAGRKGYARLALRTGSPIVCVAQAGSHNTLMVLSDGQRVAEKLRLKKYFRANIFPVHLSFPFGFSIGPTPHLPPPCRLRYRIAPAVYPPALPPGTEPTEEMVDALDREVRAVMQAELDKLADTSPRLSGRLVRFARRIGRGAG